MPTGLVVLGAILIVLAIGLAFTIFGLISAVLGVVCVGVGAAGLRRADLGRGPREEVGEKFR